MKKGQAVEVEERDDGNGAPRGKITMGPGIIEKIAGLVAREIEGIYAIGKFTLVPFGDKDRRGVDAEVGELEAALDLEVIIEYGADIKAVAAVLCERLAEQIKLMTGRTLIEVNVELVGVHRADDPAPEAIAARVR